MNKLAPAGRRTLHQRGPLRRALLDPSVLTTTDIVAATRRPAPSSFVAGARPVAVRCDTFGAGPSDRPRTLASHLVKEHRSGEHTIPCLAEPFSVSYRVLERHQNPVAPSASGGK
ncbi:hypothetical protein AB0L42_26770 [Streptomyces sp. NPDC052287]|uniref:hypothetical protein n=1 Tax=Streptomyces sp. NPDC052287 TaxID=3154950 RepID=UPI003431720C